MEIQQPINLDDRTLYFTSLGCSKNLVDAQVMLGHLGLDGFQVVQEPEQAEVIIVNTCSFIQAAKEESISTVLDLADFKDPDNGTCKALVMAGCMAQRYSTDLEDSLPEVDMFIGTGEYHKIVPLLKALEEGKLEKKSFVDIPKYIHTDLDPRVNTSPGYTAWLKVSEGCNRNCTFCIIPTLRGRLRSRKVESLIQEAKNLQSSGVRELNVISQDLSDFGTDTKENLKDLVAGLATVEGIDWVRLFYYYPEDMSEDVMDVMAKEPSICNYLDMPIQHFSSSVLRRMNRRATTEMIYGKLEALRKRIPNIVLRTSVIVGFPGETEEDFQTLLEGIKTSRFDHLGVFKYSDEEGTPAVKLKDKIPQEIIDKRYQQIYEAQKQIAHEINQKYIGQTLRVLVEGAHDETELLLQGRHEGQAPDIDGKVIINDGWAHPGDLVEVEITEVHEYDLVGRILPTKH